jgi:hypothetical protein
MLQSISASVCMYFWSTKWHIETTRLSVYTETVFSNPCQKYLKIPFFFSLWGKIAVLEYEGLSVGVKHSSWQSALLQRSLRQRLGQPVTSSVKDRLTLAGPTRGGRGNSRAQGRGRGGRGWVGRLSEYRLALPTTVVHGKCLYWIPCEIIIFFFYRDVVHIVLIHI